MIKIKAKIELYNKKGGRRTPFCNQYRPVFQFVKEIYTSGQITLLDRERFFPGTEGIVEIKFLFRELLGSDFGIGKEFIFSEGLTDIGKGIVIEILTE